MKKSRKLMLKVLPVFLVLTLIVVSTSNVFAIKPSLPNMGGSEISGITNLAGSVWKTASVIIQILAIAAIILAGLRYMFASADEKADIKKQTVILVAGAALVFAAVPLAGFISNIVNGALK